MFGDHHIELSQFTITNIDDEYIHVVWTRPKCCGRYYNKELKKVDCKEFPEMRKEYKKKHIPDHWKTTQQEAVNHMFKEIEDEINE